MTNKELIKVEIIQKVQDKRITQQQPFVYLHLTSTLNPDS